MFDKPWKIALLVVAVGLLVGGVVYWATRETPRPMTPLMHDLAVASTRDVALTLPRDTSVNTLLVLIPRRGPRDEEAELRRMLLAELARTDKYRMRTWQEVLDTLDTSFLGQVFRQLNLAPGEEPGTLPRAVEVVRRLRDANYEVDGILLVDLAEFTEGPNADGLGARIRLGGTLHSLRTNASTSLPPVSHEITSPWDLRYLSFTLSRWSLIGRFLGWFVLGAGLPWGLITLVRAVLRRRKNELNIAVLVAFTLLDVLVAWVLLCALGTGGGSIVTLLVVAGLMGYYNYDALDYIERRLL